MVLKIVLNCLQDEIRRAEKKQMTDKKSVKERNKDRAEETERKIAKEGSDQSRKSENIRL